MHRGTYVIMCKCVYVFMCCRIFFFGACVCAVFVTECVRVWVYVCVCVLNGWVFICIMYYVSVFMCMYAWLLVCMFVFVYPYICIYVGVHICVCCTCVRVYLYPWVFGYVLQRCELVRAIWTNNRRPRPDPDSCSLWTRYTGDSETGPWDDSEIRTGSCILYTYECLFSYECLWRPNGYSVPKLRYFIWVFVLMSFPYLPLIISTCVLLALFHVGNW